MIADQNTSLIRLESAPHKLYVKTQAMDIELMYIQPGKPTQNAYIERFNHTARQECLNLNLFDSVQYPLEVCSVESAQNITTQWLWIYNNQRPHFAIGRMPPRSKVV